DLIKSSLRQQKIQYRQIKPKICHKSRIYRIGIIERPT
ncbi:MAG: hypothetical protein ACI8V2_005444, partial [Candidatus Latescibacterota bacterium]